MTARVTRSALKDHLTIVFCLGTVIILASTQTEFPSSSSY